MATSAKKRRFLRAMTCLSTAKHTIGGREKVHGAPKRPITLPKLQCLANEVVDEAETAMRRAIETDKPLR